MTHIVTVESPATGRATRVLVDGAVCHAEAKDQALAMIGRRAKVISVEGPDDEPLPRWAVALLSVAAIVLLLAISTVQPGWWQ